MSDDARARRLEVKDEIISCTRCPLSQGQVPVPFSGPTPAQVAIVGEAPGKNESEQGEPFIGKSGQLLRDALTDVGFDLSQIFIANTVCCLPLDEKDKVRRPSQAEVEACRPNLEAQLALADPKYVLVLGAVSLYSFRPDLKVSRSRRRVFVRDGRFHFMTWHPAAALYDRDGVKEKQLREDLRVFKALTESDKYTDLVSDRCVHCGAWALRWDDEAVPYCADHWPHGDPKKWGPAPAPHLITPEPQPDPGPDYQQEAMV